MFECCCSYDDNGVDARCNSAKMIKARKPHVCCECHKTIEKGEIHEYAKGWCEGGWWDSRTCKTCLAIWNDFCPDGIKFVGGLKEQLIECDWDVEDLGF